MKGKRESYTIYAMPSHSERSVDGNVSYLKNFLDWMVLVRDIQRNLHDEQNMAEMAG